MKKDIATMTELLNGALRTNESKINEAAAYLDNLEMTPLTSLKERCNERGLIVKGAKTKNYIHALLQEKLQEIDLDEETFNEAMDF